MKRGPPDLEEMYHDLEFWNSEFRNIHLAKKKEAMPNSMILIYEEYLLKNTKKQEKKTKPKPHCLWDKKAADFKLVRKKPEKSPKTRDFDFFEEEHLAPPPTDPECIKSLKKQNKEQLKAFSRVDGFAVDYPQGASQANRSWSQVFQEGKKKKISETEKKASIFQEDPFEKLIKAVQEGSDWDKHRVSQNDSQGSISWGSPLKLRKRNGNHIQRPISFKRKLGTKAKAENESPTKENHLHKCPFHGGAKPEGETKEEISGSKIKRKNSFIIHSQSQKMKDLPPLVPNKKGKGTLPNTKGTKPLSAIEKKDHFPFMEPRDGQGKEEEKKRGSLFQRNMSSDKTKEKKANQRTLTPLKNRLIKPKSESKERRGESIKIERQQNWSKPNPIQTLLIPQPNKETHLDVVSLVSFLS